jgi:hypothetical protein
MDLRHLRDKRDIFDTTFVVLGAHAVDMASPPGLWRTLQSLM